MRALGWVILTVFAALLLLLLIAPHAHGQTTNGPVQSVTYVGPVLCASCPAPPCAGHTFGVVASGTFPSSCWAVLGIELVPSMVTVIGPPTVRIRVGVVAPVCATVLTPWTASALLPPLPPGGYALPVEYVIARDSLHGGDSTVVQTFPLTVSDCPPQPLPYVQGIAVGPPTCATLPIPVDVAGATTDNCTAYLRTVLVPPPPAFAGTPPTLRIEIGYWDCVMRPCVLDTVPFTAHLEMPALPAGSYTLPVQVLVRSLCDSTRLIGVNDGTVPFVVGTDCVPPTLCLREQWGEPPYGPGCDALLLPGDSAGVDLRIASTVALAGLQGSLRVDSTLRVADLEPAGPAAGMHLQWIRTPGGARFVMFAESGAPIPPFATAPNDTAYDFWPVLHVTVTDAWTDAHGLPPTAALWADSLLGADSLGRPVGPCLRDCAGPLARCLPPYATICRVSTACDFNGDGIADVRDLVTMVHCVLGTGPCADTTRSRYDCDHNGLAQLEDVICCARVILRGGRPDTLHARPDPAVTLAFGEPQRDAAGVTLAMTLSGADRLGAARVALRYPSDRYVVESVAVPDPARWLALDEEVDGQAVIGLVSLGADGGPATLPVTVRLALRPGQAHGGQVEVTGADLSAPDGAALLTSATGSGALLDPAARLALGPGRPNPFGDRTTFSLALPRAGDVTLAVYDLAGRRIATLQRGRLPAGLHAFEWNGRDDDGRAARDGIYFAAVHSDAGDVSRKVILRRGN